MSDNKQKQDFSARLQRIQEKHGHEAPEPSQPIKAKPQPDNNKARNAVIWIVLACFAGAGSYYGLMKFDEKRKQSQSLVNEQESAPETQSSQPLAIRQITDQGWSVHSPGLASADLAELVVSDVAVGFDPSDNGKPPRALIPFDVNGDCTLKRPRQTDVVYNVRLDSGTLPTTTHAFSNETAADALIDHIHGVTQSQKHYLAGSRARGRMFAVDVFVTDTSAPVYLVLQSWRQNVIWHLQLADGVELAHVAMIGENSGLVAPDADVKFEALRISDFVTDFEFGANDEPQPCMIAPWRQPQPHWPAQNYANNGNDLYENQIYSFNTGYRAFDAWYSQTLGVSADTNVTAPFSAAHVLVGSVPDQPIQYRSTADRDVYMSNNDFMLIGDDKFEDAHIALLTAAVGGDLSLLDPAPQEVSQ